MLVATGIDDLDLHLLAVDFACTLEHVKHVRDVVVGEGIRIVVCDQAGLANS